jgi:hypothetical protein
MRPKFTGLAALAVMAAIVCLSSATNQTGSNAFRDDDNAKAQCSGGGLQSLSAFSSCSDSGGLQSFASPYSGCSGGGDVGGGLQFAPQAMYTVPTYSGYGGGGMICGPNGCFVTSAAPYYRPAMTSYAYRPTYRTYAAAPIISAPVSVAPPRVNFGLLNFNVGQAVPAGIRLAPGETYVAGSLRAVPSSPRTVAATRVPDSPVKAVTLPEDTELIQISHSNCVDPCKNDRNRLAAIGVIVRVLKTDGSDAERFETERLLEGKELKVYPSYAFVQRSTGKRIAFKSGPFQTTAFALKELGASGVLRERYVAWRADLPKAAVAEAPRPDKLDLILDRLEDLSDRVAVLEKGRKDEPAALSAR